MPLLIHHDNSVHQNIVDPRWVDIRMVVGHVILNVVVIEDGDVGPGLVFCACLFTGTERAQEPVDVFLVADIDSTIKQDS
jgi:hypothetical protein